MSAPVSQETILRELLRQALEVIAASGASAVVDQKWLQLAREAAKE